MSVPVEGENNLWSDLLRDSSKRSQNPEATCLFLGDASCGKVELIEKICSMTNRNQSDQNLNENTKEILTFNYFEVDDGLLESTSRINIYVVGDQLFRFTPELLVNATANRNDRLLLGVMIDLSKPDECIPSLIKWLNKASAYIRTYYGYSSPEQEKRIKALLVNYLKTARVSTDPKAKQDFSPNEPTGAEVEVAEIEEELNEDGTPVAKVDKSVQEKYDFISDNFGLPIVVIGCKSDLIPQEDNAAINNAREVQAQIRTFCVEVGAALIYTSTTKNTNCSQLRKYLMHRLYPEYIPLDLYEEDRIEEVLIPSGFDTFDLINIKTGNKVKPNAFKSQFDSSIGFEPLPVTVTSTTVEANTEPNLEIENEQEWLMGLYNSIVQVYGIAPSTSSHQRSNSGMGESIEGALSPNNPANQPNGGELGEKSQTGMVKQLVAANTGRKQIVKAQGSVGPAEKKDVGDFFKNLLERK
eukprot:gene5039-7030_t